MILLDRITWVGVPCQPYSLFWSEHSPERTEVTIPDYPPQGRKEGLSLMLQTALLVQTPAGCNDSRQTQGNRGLAPVI